MKSKRLFAILLALMVAIPIPVYADETSELSVQLDENVEAQTSSDSDADEAEDGEDAVYQNGSINGRDTSSYETIEIKTPDDLHALADNCHSDAWSQDKHVVLEADLALSGENRDIEIPTFGGIFDGNGHTISGLVVSSDAADRGLFGTIQESGLVQNLTVKGSITPSGTQSRLGGIAGTNYGQIVDCSFQGTIDADAEVGGIVGRNKLSGVVSGCSSRGTITGNSYTGGIVGYNEGEIQSCSSRTNVNIDYTDTSVSTDQITNTINNILQSGTLNSTENIQARTDTGGIAGFSSGNVYDCTNAGNIGYEHVGYNTGGIVGRSSGMVNGCSNSGKVLGRKDVGGVAGQLTPNLRLDFEEGTLGEISDQLDVLDNMVDNTLDSTQSYSNDTSARLERISALTGSAKDSTKVIADNAQNKADEVTPRINNATSTAQSALSTLSNVTGTVSDYSSRLQSSMNSLDGSVESFIDEVRLTDDEKSRAKSIISRMNDDLSTIKKDLKEITDIVAGGKDRIRDNTDTINKDVQEILDCADDLNDCCGELEALLAGKEGWDDSEAEQYLEDLRNDTALLTGDVEEVLELVKRIASSDDSVGDIQEILDDWTDGAGDEDSYEAIADKAESVASWIDTYIQDMDPESDEYKELDELRQSLRSDSSTIDGSLNQIEDIVRNGNASTRDDIDRLTENLKELQGAQSSLLGQVQSAGSLMSNLVDHYGNLNWSDLRDSIDGLQSTLNNAPEISSQIQSALNSLASLDLHIDGISDSTRTAGDDLYSSMSSLLDEMDALNSVVNSNTNSTYDDIRAISSQISSIADLFNDAVNGVTDNVDDDHIEDVSAEDIDGSTRGRLTSCTNRGTVEADNNVGGIAGTMGMEYDLDPEKDIQKFGDTSLDYAYRVKCIVDRCENHGKISIANNYGGGIVGHMEMGVISQSADYGTIDSEGRYIGGITGYTVGTVQNCYAKADIAGGQYVGGIAGYAETLYDNAAMVNITDSEQYVGAIAGKVKELDRSKVSGNTYVSTAVYGIDGISYQGIAEGITYDALLAKQDLPTTFGTIRLIFTANDTFLTEIDCNYGDSIDASQIPEVPAKEGFHGEWSRTDFSHITADETIEAVYSRINTLLSSEQTRDTGKPVILVSGDFAEGDALQVVADVDNSEDRQTWTVSIPDDGQQTHEIRYLPVSEDPESVAIYVQENGHKERVTTSEMGKYITFEAAGQDVTFVAQKESTGSRIGKYAAIGGGAAAVAAALAAGHAGLSKARRKKRAEERRKRNR